MAPTTPDTVVSCVFKSNKLKIICSAMVGVKCSVMLNLKHCIPVIAWIVAHETVFKFFKINGNINLKIHGTVTVQTANFESLYTLRGCRWCVLGVLLS